jgi:drug/metabolite transporter (DMT)-like permease
MTALAALLALSAAFFHAAWNVRLKGADDPLPVTARAVPLATLVATPAVAVAWLAAGRPGLPWQGWLLVLASCALEVARGTAPLVSVVIGLAVLRERLSPAQLAGVVVLLAGIWLVRPPRGRRASLAPALLTGLAIAGYTAVDRVGVRLGPFWLYSWLVFASLSLSLLPWVGRRRVEGAPVVGLLMVGSYTVVLAALSIAPLALVAPLRESGVVLVSLWGVLRLGEREGAALKLTGAAAVLAGAALLALG